MLTVLVQSINRFALGLLLGQRVDSLLTSRALAALGALWNPGEEFGFEFCRGKALSYHRFVRRLRREWFPCSLQSRNRLHPRVPFLTGDRALGQLFVE